MEISKFHFNWADPKSQLIFQSETNNFSIEERFRNQAEDLSQNFGLTSEDQILDYGCGIGKHAICLKKNGYKVLGYDPSEHYIKQARETMEHEKVQLDFHKSTDFFDASYGQFNFIYSIDFPFYCLDEKSINTLFSDIRKLLADNGRFLFGFPYTRENREYFLPRNKWEEKDGLLYLTDEKIDKEGKRTERYIIIDIKNESVTEWIDEVKYYYVSEIKDFLIKSGFAIIGVFENLKKKIPDDGVNVHFILCEKHRKGARLDLREKACN